MTLGHILKTRNTTVVNAKARVKIKKIELANDASDKKFMVWLKRKGKSRGTALAQGRGLDAIFNEDITLSVTLYRDHRTGLYHRKRFSISVFCQPQLSDQAASVGVMAKEFGWCEIDVSHSSELRSVRLRPPKVGTYVDAHIWFSVTLDDRC